MCGIVGVVTKQSYGFLANDTKIFDNLLYMDALRGVDSTGVISVNRYGTVEVLKDATPAWQFQKTITYKNSMDAAAKNGKVLVGHNRAATKGAITDQNAHPFSVDHITLVHNGTLHNHRTFSKQDVDSHAIAELIADKGYKHALETIEGAFALVWWDSKEEKLFFTRNAARPLGYVYNKEKTLFMFASEVFMIPPSALRNATSLDDKFYLFQSEKLDKTGYVYKLNPENLELEVEETSFFRFKPTQIASPGGGYFGLTGYEDDVQFADSQASTLDTTKKAGAVIVSGALNQKAAEEAAKGGKTSGSQAAAVLTPPKSKAVRPTGIPLTYRSAMARKIDISKEQFWLNEAKNTRIVFNIKRIIPAGEFGHWVVGSWGDIDIFSLIYSHDVPRFTEFPQASGDVSGVSVNNGKVKRITMTKAKPHFHVVTRNRVTITDRVWREIKDELYCNECDGDITQHNIQDAVIRLETRGTGQTFGVKKAICGTCCNHLAEMGNVEPNPAAYVH